MTGASKKVTVDNNALKTGDNGGIIREQSKKPITKITDSAINRVAKVDIPTYTGEQCEIIQQKHKELLQYSRDKNNNNEVAFALNGNFESLTPILGDEEGVNLSSLQSKGLNLTVMHNHPKNSSFSNQDINIFIDMDTIRTLTIIKNNGKMECITKLPGTSKEDMSILWKRSLSIEMKRVNQNYKK